MLRFFIISLWFETKENNNSNIIIIINNNKSQSYIFVMTFTFEEYFWLLNVSLFSQVIWKI